jgi:hypothetical protein
VQFSAKEGVFASSDDEGKILVWDVRKIGEEVVNSDANDGPPEMIVIDFFICLWLVLTFWTLEQGGGFLLEIRYERG